MDTSPAAASSTTSSSTTLERSSSAKRKRCGKSPAEPPSPFSGRLFQLPLCRPSSEEGSSSSLTGADPGSAIPELETDPSTSDMAVQTDAMLADVMPARLLSPASSMTELASPNPIQQHSFGLTTAAISTATTAIASNSAIATTTWSFLAHPALRLLPKWPALYSSAATQAPNPAVRRPGTLPMTAVSNPADKEATSAERIALQLLSLLDIPPIAASIASNLYGHDLLNLRLLNSSFKSLLSSETSRDGQRPYFHTLLLKSLLCPRNSTTLEPVGVSCKSSGGNVGPCVFCCGVVCNTCVSPEIWTTRRYRYLCPPCTASPSSDDFCKCQERLWICRSCYVSRWLEDLLYSAGGWIANKPGFAATCELCGIQHSHKTDNRIPNVAPKGRREDFAKWMSAVGSAVLLKGAKPKKSRITAGVTATADETGRKVRKRPVGCGWCRKRVNAEREDWELRPDKIRKGEERGRLWNMELERRRRERDGYDSEETGSGGAASAG